MNSQLRALANSGAWDKLYVVLQGGIDANVKGDDDDGPKIDGSLLSVVFRRFAETVPYDANDLEAKVTYNLNKTLFVDAVSALVSHPLLPPESLSTVEVWNGLNVLHWAVGEQYANVALRVLSRCPDASRQVQDETGELPLHVAVTKPRIWRDGARGIDVIDALIAAHPDSVRVQATVARSTPLHCAIKFGHLGNGDALLHDVGGEDGEEVAGIVPALVAACSDTLSVADANGDSPLHIACGGAEEQVIRYLAEHEPGAASLTNKYRETPLHVICGRLSFLGGFGDIVSYDVEIVTALISCYPTALTLRDQGGMTPLHVACNCGASQSVVGLLAGASRDALLALDKDGYTPLALYCRHASDYSCLRVLVEACPRAAAVAGGPKGQLPLHRVCTGFNLSVNVDVIRLLLEAHPDGVSALDLDGNTPLALLCQSYQKSIRLDIARLKSEGQDPMRTLIRSLTYKQWLMARCLILASPVNKERAGHSNGDEYILHATLAEQSSSVDLIEFVSLIYPKQLQKSDGGDLPLHIAATRVSETCEHNSFDIILSSYPEASRKRNSNDKYPLNLLIESKRTWSTGIKSVLHVFPEALFSLNLDNKAFSTVLARLATDRDCFGNVFEMFRGRPSLFESTDVRSTSVHRPQKRPRT